MKYPPDAGHPLTEQFAADLYARSDLDNVPGTEPWRDQIRQPWKRAEPDLREVFRARARLLLAGDITVIPVSWPMTTPSHLRRLPG